MSERTKISTLIFMDLETTGLPSDVGKKNVQITEMSFVAIDRNSFENDKSLRAINKLSLCVRPRSIVSPGAMTVTGLYNDVLEQQEVFDDTVPKVLEYFFRRLQVPICLLAHNGKKFDFPILQAELNRLNYALDSNILCADTLVAFRSVCLMLKPAKEPDPPKEDCSFNVCNVPDEASNKPSDVGPLSEDDIDNLLTQDLESFACMASESEEKILSSSNHKMQNNELQRNMNQPKLQETATVQSEFLDPNQNAKTPTNSKLPFNLIMNVKKQKILNRPQNDSVKEARSAKRALFPDPCPLPQKITKFTLESLYEHFFRESPPKSHCAEADCISLSKVCQKINKDFLEWIDKNNEAFCNVQPLW